MFLCDGFVEVSLSPESASAMALMADMNVIGFRCGQLNMSELLIGMRF